MGEVSAPEVQGRVPEAPGPAAAAPPRPSLGPHRAIVPRRGLAFFHPREIWAYRSVFYQFSRRDLTLRYRQTAVGVAWVILQPLLGAGIFTFVFGKVAHLSSDGVPYFVFSYAGLWIWNAFNSTITAASPSILNYSTMVTKVYFPRVILPLSVTTASVINAGVSLCMLFVLLGIYHIPFTLHLLTVPLWLLLALVMAQGPALLFAALMVRYRDVSYVQPVLIQFLMFLTPVVYSTTAVHSFRWIMSINPLTGLLNGGRWALLGLGHLSLASTLYTVAMAGVFAVIGGMVFEQMERTFSDVI